MCEANVYLINEAGKEELLFELVDKIRPENEKLVLENIFGQQKILSAQIKEMSLASHRVVVEMVKKPE
jgi:predicted RNA-binding protein